MRLVSVVLLVRLRLRPRPTETESETNNKYTKNRANHKVIIMIVLTIIMSSSRKVYEHSLRSKSSWCRTGAFNTYS